MEVRVRSGSGPFSPQLNRDSLHPGNQGGRIGPDPVRVDGNFLAKVSSANGFDAYRLRQHVSGCSSQDPIIGSERRVEGNGEL